MVDELLKELSTNNVIESCFADCKKSYTTTSISEEYFWGSDLARQQSIIAKKLDEIREKIAVYDFNVAQKNLFLEECAKNGINPSGTSKKMKDVKEKFKWDAPLLRSSRDKLVEKQIKIENELQKYYLLNQWVQPQRQVDIKQYNKPIVDINDIDSLVWYNWPEEVLGIEYEGDALAGIGPGEYRVSFLIGGAVHGNSTSYDISIPDGRVWEVKGISSETEDIRTGAKGIIAFDYARNKFRKIFDELGKFCSLWKSLGLSSYVSTDLSSKFNLVNSFYERENINFVVKGDVSKERLIRLRACLYILSDIKNTLTPITKSLNMRLIINTLNYSVSDKPDAILNDIGTSTLASSAFSGISGIFLVNRDLGMMLIREHEYDSSLVFVRSFLGKPCYSLSRSTLANN